MARLLAAAALACAAATAQVVARAYTADDCIRLQRGSYLAVGAVQRVEIGGAASDLEAWAGTHAWPLVKDPHKPVLVLTVDDKLRQAWRQHGTLTIGYVTQRDQGGELTLRASPSRLALPEEGAAFTVKQRRSVVVPHTGDYLEVRIGDITAGQTLLRIDGADGRSLASDRSVGTGDAIELDLGEARYVLEVKRLHNLLIGDDWAELLLVPAERHEADRIEALLRRIGSADVRFVREGRTYSGTEAAAHLRQKYEHAGGKMTLERFITEIASRSSTTGRAYEILHEDGTSEPAEGWMRRQAAGKPERRP